MIISDVQMKSGFYRVYDEDGEMKDEVPVTNAGELCGMGLEFLVFLKGGSYTIYDPEERRKVKELQASSMGVFRNANGRTIVFEKSSSIDTFRVDGKKVCSRMK